MSSPHDDIDLLLGEQLITLEEAERLKALPITDHEQLQTALGKILGRDIATEVMDLLVVLREIPRTFEADEEASARAMIDGLPPRYEIQKYIGRGGMGVVFKAIDTNFPRVVAIKVARQDRFPEETERRLMEERSILSGLNDPHLVIILDAEKLASGRPYFTMEFVDGIPLIEYAQGVDLRTALVVFEKIARAVGKVHAKDCIHRDLTPDNILVTADGTPKVLDFGIAKLLQDADANEFGRRLSSLRRVFSYAEKKQPRAPEVRHYRDATKRSDVYDLGMLLNEITHGSRTKEDRIDDRGLQAILDRATAPEPSDRYPAAGELADDLACLLRDEPVEAVSDHRSWYLVRNFTQRHRGTIRTLLGSAFFVALLTLLYGVSMQQSAEREKDQRIRGDTHETIAAQERERSEGQSLRRFVTTASEQISKARYHDAYLSLQQVPPARWGWECSHLAFLADAASHPRRVLGGHDWGIAAMLLSKHDGTIVTAGHDGRLLARDRATGSTSELQSGAWSERHRWWKPVIIAIGDPPEEPSTDDAIVGLCWVRDPEEFVSVSYRGQVTLWQLASGASESIFVHESPLCCISSAAEDRTIAIGDVTGKLLLLDVDRNTHRSIETSGEPIAAVEHFAPKQWLVATEEGKVYLAQETEPAPLLAIDAKAPIWGIAWNGTTKLLAVAAERPAILIYTYDENRHSWALLRELPLEPTELRRPAAAIHVAWSSDGERLVAADDLGQLWAWDAPSWTRLWVRSDQRELMFPAVLKEWLPHPLQRRTSSIQFDERAGVLWTAGLDTTLKEWPLITAPARTTLAVAGATVASFDPNDEALLLIGDAGGRLSLWDVETDRSLASVAANAGPVENLVGARRARIAATSRGTEIRWWRWSSDSLEPIGDTSHAPSSARSLAITPSGDRLAAYLDDDSVALWQSGDQQRITHRSLSSSPGKSDVQGELAFNALGNRLAVAGPEASSWVLDAANLEVLDRPYLFGGANGTALDAHPTGDFFIGANDRGRIQFLPETAMSENTDGILRGQPVADAKFSPDGKRAIVASVDGVVTIVEPHLGPLYTLESSHTQSHHVRLKGIALNRSASSLALTHDDGVIEIVSALPAPQPLPDESSRWVKQTLLDGADFADAYWRWSSVAVDDDSIALLYLRSIARSPTREAAPRLLCLGRIQDNKMDERILVDLGPLDDRAYNEVWRSLTFRRHTKGYWATYRRPRPDQGPTIGELVLLDIPNEMPDSASGSATHHETIVSGDRNGGFDVANLGGDPLPRLLHYAEGDRCLHLTQHGTSGCDTVRLGREGDGFRMSATTVGNQLHVFFNPTRFNGDLSPTVHLLLNPSKPEFDAQRRSFDTAQAHVVLDARTDKDGTPIILVLRRDPSGGSAYALLKYHDHQWREIASLHQDWSNVACSNLLPLPGERYLLALWHPFLGELRLYKLSEKEHRAAVIGRLDVSTHAGEDFLGVIQPSLAVDKKGTITVLLGERWRHKGSLTTFFGNLSHFRASTASSQMRIAR